MGNTQFSSILCLFRIKISWREYSIQNSSFQKKNIHIHIYTSILYITKTDLFFSRTILSEYVHWRQRLINLYLVSCTFSLGVLSHLFVSICLSSLWKNDDVLFLTPHFVCRSPQHLPRVLLTLQLQEEIKKTKKKTFKRKSGFPSPVVSQPRSVRKGALEEKKKHRPKQRLWYSSFWYLTPLTILLLKEDTGIFMSNNYGSSTLGIPFENLVCRHFFNCVSLQRKSYGIEWKKYWFERQ